MLRQGIQHHVQEESRVLPTVQRIIGDQELPEIVPEFKRIEGQQQEGSRLGQTHGPSTRRPAPILRGYLVSGA